MIKTPAEEWKTKITQYRKNCQNILEISNAVRYAGVINSYGRTLTGIVNPNVKPLLKSEQVKNEFFVVSTLMALRKATSNAIGKLNYVLLSHQKASIITIQKNNVTYYVSIEKKEKDLDKIISSINKII